MSEVLSQSQIDALLNAVRSGEKNLDQSPEESQKKSYRKYDFKSPRKFTKDRIKMLSGIFENYTRVINSRMNTLFHTTCEVMVESVEEQRYYEFSNALTDGDVLALISAQVKEKPEESPALLHLSTSLGLCMMDRMMGGEGHMDYVPGADYTYTDLELKLFENIVSDLVSVMGVSWENYISIDFKYNRTEVNPTLVQLIGLDEIVVIVDMKVQFSESSGRLSIVLPGMMLTNIFGEINRDNPVRKISDEDNSEEIFDQLRESSLEVVAELGTAEMTLSDIFHLNVGDVIDLGQPKDNPIFLEIGGYNWFTGRMGTYKKNMAVKIDEVCYRAERRSE